MTAHTPVQGQAGGLPVFMSRRAALGSVAIASAIPGVVLAAQEPEDPIMPVYREWCAARIEWIKYAEVPGNENWDSPESLAAQEREDEAFWTMVNDMVPTSLAGIGALTHVLWSVAGPSFSRDRDGPAIELDDPKDILMLKIWQAASGETALDPDGHLD
jgi:hypothetical protein